MLFLLTACTPDYAVTELCVEHEDGFDIEAVSVLQGAAGYPASRDAVTLTLDPGPDVESWRVARIEVLAQGRGLVFPYSAGAASTGASTTSATGAAT
ncbi:MAG: hypothetical protein GY913_10640 [Proteobacteria bacterium]|nr:hypothetical protein [Pseudomonadota bacterium]MCP4917370.1 hypothetical protein [Pseudomonadota bacterium]